VSEFAMAVKDPRINTMAGGESVLAFLALPPPTHGQSAINAIVVAKLTGIDGVRATVVDIGPGRSGRGWRYHLTRLRRVAAALAQVFWNAPVPRRAVYTVVESGWGIFYNLLLVSVSRIFGYHLILHHHTSAHVLADRYSFRWLAQLAGPRAIHVVLSPAMADDLSRRYPAVANVIVVHNAGTISAPQEPSPVGSELPRLRLGFLSNLSDDKGLDTVFSLLRNARSNGLDLVLHLAGPAMTAKAAADIALAKREFGAALKVMGPLYGPANAAFYEQVDVFLFPSRYLYEAQPLVVIDAMAHGRPVVALNRGYVAELIGTGGVVVADSQAFISITTELCRAWLTNPNALRRCARASRERFLELHTTGVIEFEGLISCLLRRDSDELVKGAARSFESPL
jgi:glycosyltransferase involved in cell wall biosynthesis